MLSIIQTCGLDQISNNVGGPKNSWKRDDLFRMMVKLSGCVFNQGEHNRLVIQIQSLAEETLDWKKRVPTTTKNQDKWKMESIFSDFAKSSYRENKESKDNVQIFCYLHIQILKY